MISAEQPVLDLFWAEIRNTHPLLPVATPVAWAFGATAEHADGLLELVLSGTKTGTASSGWDYEEEDEQPPVAGELSIVLDSSGTPRAVIETTQVRTVPFSEVDAEHAWAEGEGDRSLQHWRDVHERFWRTHSPRGWAPDMPVLCELFRLIHPTASDRPT